MAKYIFNNVTLEAVRHEGFSHETESWAKDLGIKVKVNVNPDSYAMHVESDALSHLGGYVFLDLGDYLYIADDKLWMMQREAFEGLFKKLYSQP